MSKNYFKTRNGTFLFFDDNVLESIECAFQEATTLDAECSIYRVPNVSGPWDKLAIVGHRSRSKILNELANTTSGDDKFWLAEELSAIRVRFQDAGRLPPPEAVAA